MSSLVSFFDENTIGHAELADDRMRFRVPRPDLVVPDELRFNVSTLVSGHAIEQKDGSLRFGSVIDLVPDPDGAAMMTTLDGRLVPGPELDGVAPPDTPITAAVLRRPDAGSVRPTLKHLRDTTSAFIERHQESLSELTDVDGLGAFDAKARFLTILSTMALEAEDYESVEPNPEHDHALAAAVGTALLMYVAERTTSEALRVDATELAATYYDYAVATWTKRAAVRRWVTGYLLGFAP